MTDPTPPADRDHLTRFLIAGAGVRGVRVHLDEAWQQIRSRAAGSSSHEAPPAAAVELLGEAAAAAALFTGHAKIDGRLSIQLRGDGTLRTLFAECTAAGTLRGIVQLAEDGEVSRDLRTLGPDAVLAITIENPSAGGRDPMRYQGMVSLKSDSLAGAFEDYFRQSEQLPTRLLLAADGAHAAGLMLQKLPGDEGDDDGWIRAGALFDTLRPQELLDWSGDTMLTRLFHEDGVQVIGNKPLRFACSCSRERVEAMLVSLGHEEARAAVADDVALVRCEFCGQRYQFSGEEIESLLATASIELAAPDRLQ
ncbi:MAG: Hsp33 family molecular chaperone HslO [Lysobacter sp.]